MRIFDPHIHMTSRTTDDYERDAAAGVRALVEPAFWLGQPRTSVGSFIDYFDSLVGWEPLPRRRSSASAHHCTIGAQPEGGQRPALPRRARRAAALPGQGRRRRGRRDRLRLDDAGGGRGLRRAARPGRRARAAGAGAHPAPRQGRAARDRTIDVVRESGIDPGCVVVDHLNEVDRRRRSPTAAAGWASPSTRTRRWTSDRMVAILQEHGPERILVNSAADWGRSRPAARPARPARRCWPPASPTTTSTGCCGATRWSSTARAARLDARRPSTPDRHASRATRSCRAGAADAAAAPRRPGRPPGLLHQRPPRGGPRRRPRRSSTLRGPVRGRCSAPPCSASGCGWPPTSPPRWPTTRRCGRLAAPRAGRARPGGGDPQRLPVQGVPRAGRQERRLPAGLGRPAAARGTRSDLARLLARAAARRRRAGLDLHAAAGLARPAGTADAGRRRPPGPGRARRRARRPAERTGSRSGSRSSRSPGASSRTSRRRRRTCRRARPRTASASAWTLRTWRAVRGPGRRGAAPRRAPGCRWSRCRCPRRSPSSDPQPRAASARAPTSSRGSCTRPAPAAARASGSTTSPRRWTGGCPAGPWRVHFHVPLHASPEPPLTATTDVLRAGLAALARRARRRHATTSRSRRTPGASCRESSARPDDAARRRAWPPSWNAPATPLHRPRSQGALEPDDASPCWSSTSVGLTPRLLAAHAAAAQLARTAARRRCDPSCPPSPAPCSRRSSPARCPPTTASSATAGTSGTSARSSCGASTTSSCGGEKLWDAARRAKPGLHGRERLLVVRDGRRRRLDRHPAPDLPRRRPQGAGLLHVPAGAARRTHRPARHVPAVPLLGPDAGILVLGVDRRRRRADHGRQRRRT